MANVSLALGAEVDMASGAEVASGFGHVNGKLDRLLGRSRKAQRRTLMTSTIMPAAGFAVLDFGHVPEGSIWALVDVCTTGPDDHTIVANSQAALYAGGETPQAGIAPILGNLLRPSIAAPAVPGFWALTKDLYVQTGDCVYVLVYGAAAATNLAAVARVYEWRPGSVEEADYL